LDRREKNNLRFEETTKQGTLLFILFAEYNYTDQIKKYEMDRACSRYGDKRNVSVGKSEGKRSLRKSSSR
jgi:hypothetical protein